MILTPYWNVPDRELINAILLDPAPERAIELAQRLVDVEHIKNELLDEIDESLSEIAEIAEDEAIPKELRLRLEAATGEIRSKLGEYS